MLSESVPPDAGAAARSGRTRHPTTHHVRRRQRTQVELLNTRRWKTRVELANAILEYLEVFHNRRRRHSSLGMRTPIEYELLHTPAAA